MASPRDILSERSTRGLTGLRRRRDVQWLTLYLGAAWILYESIALTVDIFELPVTVARVTAILLALGAVVSIPLARWYRLTTEALDEGGGGVLEDVPGVPDALEPALARGHRKIGRRTATLAVAVAAVLFSGFFFVLWNAWAEGHYNVAPDPRVSVAVFPFRGGEDATIGEGVADLLSVTLDGTPGVQVIDPTALWRALRPERGAPAAAPGPELALDLSRSVGAERYVIGSLLQSGASLQLTARIYDGRQGGPLASLSAAAEGEDLGGAVQRLAIDVVAAVWEREGLPTVPEIDRLATSNADALKAYLEAKSLARRGRFQEAEAAIERAVALDSAFPLAHLAHFNIRSWNLYLNAQPYVGLREILERAARDKERLTPRNRLRIEANRALDDTDAFQATFFLDRILGIDSLDVEALHSLAFTYLRDGWQLGKDTDDITAAYDRVLRADSGLVPARLQRARVAMLTGDSTTAALYFTQLASIDTSTVVRGSFAAWRALRAEPPARDSILRAAAGQPIPVVTTALRDLRAVRPALTERFLAELMHDSMPNFHQRVASGARAQLWLAEGRLAAVDSLVRSGELDRVRQVVNRFFIASQLVGIGTPSATERSLAELAAFAPADSLEAFLNSRPAVWATGWAVGAYQASLGDTAEARIWQAALAKLPTGDSWWDWTGALSADIEARLAVRRDDMENALQAALRAFDLWTIHSSYVGEADPEPAIRFHLAQLLSARGDVEPAARLFRSFVQPHTWIGFYTARASLELGIIEEGRGNIDRAARHYLTATRLWEHGDPEVVGFWLNRAQSGLSRLTGEASH